MEALDKFMQYSKYVRSLCSLLGLDVLDHNYKRSARTYVSFVLIAVYAVISVNSIIIATETIEIVKALSFAGFFVQCVLKIYFTLMLSDQYSTNHSTIKEAIYLKHMNGTERQKAAILKRVSMLHLLVKGTSVLYCSSVVLFSIYPAYMYFLKDTKSPIFPLFIPGIDIYSAYGYGFTNSVHMMLAVYGLCGALASDTGFMMFVFHIVTYTDLFMIKLETLAEKLDTIQMHNGSRDYRAFCRIEMRDIFLSHKDIIAYLESLNRCYQNICIAQVGSCAFSISLSLFLALVTDWYATYGFLIASVFQLFIFSVLGTIIQLMNDRIIKLVYNLPWHLLPNVEKRSFQFLLFKSQRPIEMFVRGLGPLNVETFTEIMKVIYQAFTMLYSFLMEQQL